MDRTFEWKYEIGATVEWIANNKFKRVAAQFPEEMYEDSFKICQEIQNQLPSIELAIIADNKYNSCCLDEINAEHFDSECLIHYGNSCISSSNTQLKVKYIFPKKQLNISLFCEKLVLHMKESSQEIHFVVLYDLVYHHLRDEIIHTCEKAGINFHCPSVMERIEELNDAISCRTIQDHSNASQIYIGRRFGISKERENRILYIGDEEDKFITSIMMKFNEYQCTIYKVETNSFLDGWSCNKLLKKRYYMVERARDAMFIGIIISTFSSSHSMDLIEKLKMAIRHAGKKYRMYSPGSINPAKLANVSEFDAFVYLACPLNSFIDCSDYLQPIVTPFEMLLACHKSFMWNNKYLLDFKELIEENIIDKDSSEVVMDVSLLTGKMRKVGLDDDVRDDGSGDGALVAKGPTDIAVNLLDDYLPNRTWKGLEMKLGECEVVGVVEGSFGVPTAYEHEHKN